jgi:hypothetical protein
MLLPAATATATAASCSAAAIDPAAAAAAACQSLPLLICKQRQVICQHISYCILQQSLIQPVALTQRTAAHKDSYAVSDINARFETV